MTVKVIIPGVLGRYAAHERELHLEAAHVAEALEKLFARHPGLRERILDRNGHVYPYFLLTRNREELSRSELDQHELADGDRIELIGMVVGGAAAPHSSGEPAKQAADGSSSTVDIRMRGFVRRATLGAARATALSECAALEAEAIGVAHCAGRVLAEDVVAGVNVPPFRRSAMDGYAIIAADTLGASLYDPVELTLAGESMPGAQNVEPLQSGQACRIMTGAPLPEGADAVVMAEDCEEDGNKVKLHLAAATGKHVGRIGEDVALGETILCAGRWLRPQDAGLLSSIGHDPVRVVRRPRVRILVSGNELLPPGSKPADGCIVDSNTPLLCALVERDGGELVECLRLGDDREALKQAMNMDGIDLLIAAGGSSVGREDYLPELVRELGELRVHGVALRPAAPTGIGRIAGKPVFLLPGNPVSCLCGYDLMTAPALRSMAGLSTELPYLKCKRTLARRISSRVGRVDYVRLKHLEGSRTHVAPLAAAGASVLSSTTRADGFALLAEDSEGLAEGCELELFLYDPLGTGADIVN